MMTKENIEELKNLYFRVQRKSSIKPNDYTMGEIELICVRATEILEKSESQKDIVLFFNEIKKQSHYYHTAKGRQYIEPKNIDRLKYLAMDAFEELFERGLGSTR